MRLKRQVLSSERPAFPQKGNVFASKRDSWSGRRKPEKHREGFRYSEERDDRSACRRDPDIACEPLRKGEPIMRSLCARKSRRRRDNTDLTVWPMLHIHSLGAQELDTGTSIPPATPIMPQERS